MISQNEDDSPLITFALFAYNQEKYVTQAVEGAFAQTYSPMEIILSDDCSTDKTYDLIERLAKTYQGPHTIRLNRTTGNCGIGNHVNSVLKMSRGKFIIMAAGDDISLPQRTEELFNCWCRAGYPSAVYSDTIAIDEHGLSISAGIDVRIYASHSIAGKADNVQMFLKGKLPMALGCSAGYSKTIFERFGPFPSHIFSEDYVASLRAWFMDGVVKCSGKLVKYRTHAGSLTNAVRENILADNWIALRTKFIEEELGMPQYVALHVSSMYEAAIMDIDKALRLRFITDAECAQLSNIARIKKNISILRVSWWRLGALRRLFLFLRVVPYVLQSDFRSDIGQIKWMLPRILGLYIFCSLKSLLRCNQ